MNTEQIMRLEKLLDRELSAEEKERLRRIQDALHISTEDALWDILVAMEYQRTYYEELPQKIAAVSTDILRGISEAAEAEARRAQVRLAESVADLAQKLAVRSKLSTLLPMAFYALVCLLAFGSLTMWAGFRIGSGQPYDTFRILRMPSGVLMGGIALAGGLYLGIHSAREFAEGGKGWRKKMFVVLAMLTAGGMLLSLAI